MRASEPSRAPSAFSIVELRSGWRLLANCPLGPAVIRLVLIRRGVGVALLEVEPVWTPDAVVRFRQVLTAGRFWSRWTGHLPIVHRRLKPEDMPELEQRIFEAFEGQPKIALAGEGSWEEDLQELLTPKQLTEPQPMQEARTSAEQMREPPPPAVTASQGRSGRPLVLAGFAACAAGVGALVWSHGRSAGESPRPEMMRPVVLAALDPAPAAIAQPVVAAPAAVQPALAAVEPLPVHPVADAPPPPQAVPALLLPAEPVPVAAELPPVPADPELLDAALADPAVLLAQATGSSPAPIVPSEKPAALESARAKEGVAEPPVPEPPIPEPPAALLGPLAETPPPQAVAPQPQVAVPDPPAVVAPAPPAASAAVQPAPEPPPIVAPAAAPPPPVVAPAPPPVATQRPAAEPPAVLPPVATDPAAVMPAPDPPAASPPVAAAPDIPPAAPAPPGPLTSPQMAAQPQPAAPANEPAPVVAPRPAPELPASPPLAAPAPRATPAPVAQPTVVAPARPAMDPAVLDAMLRRGEALLAVGDISGARRFFERAADGGSAAAAHAMAETYDPRTLAQRRVVGLAPDRAAALTWYRRAVALGSAEAAARITALEAER